MTVHVRYNSWYISLPSSAKQQRKMTSEDFPLSGERELRRLMIILTVINKVNDLRVPRDSLVK